MTLIRELLMLIVSLLGAAQAVNEEPPRVQSAPIPVAAEAPLLPDTLAELLAESPWPESEWATVAAIAGCESSHDPSAVGDGGLALGLMQIRVDYHPGKAARYDLLDPSDNLEASWEVYVQAGYSYWPWSCAR